MYLKQGLRLTNIHRDVKFHQSAWLKTWIDLNTNFRTVSKNDFEKDYFKSINNAVFGKIMENAAFDEKYYQKYVCKPNFHSSKILVDDAMMLLKLNKKIVKLNKPIYAGVSILELSKHHVYSFHYNVMKPKYNENIVLLMTDTDSLVYKINTDDVYNDTKEMKEYFDMSAYSKTNPIYDETNKEVIGKFKDETGNKIINIFVGVRIKVHATITLK